MAPEALVESLDIPSAQKKMIAANRERVNNAADIIKTRLANSSTQPPPQPWWCLVNPISFHCLTIYAVKGKALLIPSVKTVRGRGRKKKCRTKGKKRDATTYISLSLGGHEKVM